MNRSGWTLVELLVALLVAGLAVTTAATVFRTGNVAVTAMDANAVEWTREANGRRWLHRALTGVVVQSEEGREFAGFPDRLRFHGRYWVPGGWLESGTLGVAFVDGNLVATLPDDRTVVLAGALSDATFAYRRNHGATEPWHSEWRSDTRPPLAVRLVLTTVGGAVDTLIVPIGVRG